VTSTGLDISVGIGGIGDSQVLDNKSNGGESGIVSAANSKITLKMQKSIDPPAIAAI
jgi:hypothetical protein